jgi:hypothetical protein
MQKSAIPARLIKQSGVYEQTISFSTKNAPPPISFHDPRFMVTIRATRDRCYDFKNIFAQKFGEKNGVYDSKQSKIMKKFDHNIGF